MREKGEGMRVRLPLAAIAGLAAGAAAAQGVSVATAEQFRNVEKRVSTLESQMRAVQRKVFPGGDPRFFAAEPAPPPAPPPEAAPADAGPQLFELVQRIDRLEAQQRTLTGQVEELQFRLKTLETALERARADTEFRLDSLEGRRPAAASPGASAPAPAEAPKPPAAGGPAAPPATAPTPAPRPAPPAATDPEARYLAAYGLYTARDYQKAAAELEAFAKAHPDHPRASNAQYWAGRSQMQLGRHAEAAKLFLAGYQTWPRGQRAAESLLWLGKALTAKKQPKAACQALDQLRTAYPERLTGALEAENRRARADAQCGP